MISQHILRVGIGTVTTVIVMTGLLVLGNGLLLGFRRARQAPRRDRARAALTDALTTGRFEERQLLAVVTTPRRVLAGMLLDLARALSGTTSMPLTDLARELGMVDHALAGARSALWWRRLSATRLLVLLDATDTVGVALPRLLADRHPLVRAEAATWAAAHPDAALVANLIAMLDDPDGLCRFNATNSLIRIGRPAASPLAASLRLRTGPAAARALVVVEHIPDPVFLEPALALTEDTSERVRAQATRVLGSIGGELAVTTLSSLLQDPAAEVAAAAAEGLARLEAWHSAPRIAALMGHPSWSVRRAAGLALRDLGAPGVLMLRHVLRSVDPFAVDMARQVLDIWQLDRRAVA